MCCRLARPALIAGSLLLSAQVEAPPVEFQSLAPLTVTVTFADVEWVNRECANRIGRPAAPGMIYEACAGIRRKWMILRHGALYPDGMGDVVNHETSHVRGWYHGPQQPLPPTPSARPAGPAL